MLQLPDTLTSHHPTHTGVCAPGRPQRHALLPTGVQALARGRRQQCGEPEPQLAAPQGARGAVPSADRAAAHPLPKCEFDMSLVSCGACITCCCCCFKPQGACEDSWCRSLPSFNCKISLPWSTSLHHFPCVYGMACPWITYSTTITTTTALHTLGSLCLLLLQVLNSDLYVLAQTRIALCSLTPGIDRTKSHHSSAPCPSNATEFPT